jgi:hypothetical protein
MMITRRRARATLAFRIVDRLAIAILSSSLRARAYLPHDGQMKKLHPPLLGKSHVRKAHLARRARDRYADPSHGLGHLARSAQP